MAHLSPDPAAAVARPIREGGGASPWSAPGRVRLRTLVLLRWLAIGGQTATVLFVEAGLGFDLPLGATLAVIAASAWLNLYLMVALPAQRLVREWEAAGQLAYDVLQLTVLLALTGGIANPFLLLYVAPVAVSAAVLRPATTAWLAGLAYVCVGALAVWNLPLPWYAGETLELPAAYQAGLVAAVFIGMGFTSVYAWRVAAEEERLNVALAAVQAVLAREQRLAALGGLAAAAAHELGTPLATIHLVAKEMIRAIPPDSPLLEDVQLLVSQSERCRVILRQLSAKPDTGDVVHARMPLIALLEEAADAHRDRKEVALTVQAAAHAIDKPPEIRRLPEVIHGLGNIIENATSFAASRVEVVARYSQLEIEIIVRDDGPGFPPSVLPRLGEPYISERSEPGYGGSGGGLGLGFFIAKTLLERTGGRVDFRNRSAPRTGAVVRVVFPRRAVEAL